MGQLFWPFPSLMLNPRSDKKNKNKNKVQAKNKFLNRILVNISVFFKKKSIFTHFAGRQTRNIKMCPFKIG